MCLAIENFASIGHPNKTVILGDMLELGEESNSEHKAIVDLITQKEFKNAILVGPLFCEAGKGSFAKTFLSSDEALTYLKQHPLKDASILIKGSRGIKLEKVVEAL
jgi:UDP-N-acetylmuramoyl-tripeptide--D-alanyl-D-alanine ligase